MPLSAKERRCQPFRFSSFLAKRSSCRRLFKFGLISFPHRSVAADIDIAMIPHFDLRPSSFRRQRLGHAFSPTRLHANVRGNMDVDAPGTI